MKTTITHNQALARIALSNILHCIRRRSDVRNAAVSELINLPSFFWLADTAGLDPHLTRLAFSQELASIEAAGFGLKGQGRVGGGRKA